MSTVNFSGVDAEFRSAGGALEGCGELRHHRNTRDGDAPVRHATIREPEYDFIAGHAVTVHVRMHPQRVHIEVRHLHPDRRQLLSRGALPRQQLGGQEMCAQDGIRCEARDFGIQLAGVELLGCALELADERVARGPVTLRVQVRPELRQLLDQLDVRLTVQLAKIPWHQREQVQVSGPDGGLGGARGGADGFGGAHMAGTRRNAQNQDVKCHGP